MKQLLITIAALVLVGCGPVWISIAAKEASKLLNSTSLLARM